MYGLERGLRMYAATWRRSGASVARKGLDERPAPTYGIDAPGFFVLIAAVVLLNIVFAVTTRGVGPLWSAAIVLLFAGFHVHTSLRGKFLAWRDLLDGVQLQGDVLVLDLGCGRGAVLHAIAKRLSTGRALGIDIWSRSDQSGNAAQATRRNTRAEGVDGRVDLLTGTMTALPFRTGSFDLVASSIALHNIRKKADRKRAIDEAVRVLRPGGKLVLADLRSTGSYASWLADLGMVGVARRNLGWRMWWTGPWSPTHLVTATKPTRDVPEGG
jgi:arsenite methyltransferase